VKGHSFAASKPRFRSEKSDWQQRPRREELRRRTGRQSISVLIAAEAQRGQNHVVFLENFFDELRRKVPVGK